MNAWIVLIAYLFYRFLRFSLHSLQSKLIWNLNGISSRISNPGPEDCQILSILYRKKLIDGDMATSNDFIWWHDRFVHAKDILAPDPCWTLYTIDDQFVYFVKTPKPWPFYHARNAPFAFMQQYETGTKLARMPFKAFCQFAEGSLAEPKGKVVYYSNAARSGSTLLTRAMQVDEDRIICFGEPDAFTALTIFHQRRMISDEIFLPLLKGIIKFYCKTQNPGQTYLMKVQSNATYLVPFIKKVMPQVKHMFTFRHNTRRVLHSNEKVMRGATAGYITFTLSKLLPRFVQDFFSGGAFEFELFQRFDPHDGLDHLIVIHIAPWYYYNKNRGLFDIPLIYYEDLIQEKEKSLRPVFELCGLPFDEFVGEALKAFESDSQEGTALSRENIGAVKTTPIDDSKVKMIHEMCDTLNIPRIEV